MKHWMAICCVCEKVRDEVGTEPGTGSWQEFNLYMATYRVRPEEVMFTHAYCPACLSYYRHVLSAPEGAIHRNERGGAV